MCTCTDQNACVDVHTCLLVNVGLYSMAYVDHEANDVSLMEKSDPPMAACRLAGKNGQLSHLRRGHQEWCYGKSG